MTSRRLAMLVAATAIGCAALPRPALAQCDVGYTEAQIREDLEHLAGLISDLSYQSRVQAMVTGWDAPESIRALARDQRGPLTGDQYRSLVYRAVRFANDPHTSTLFPAWFAAVPPEKYGEHAPDGLDARAEATTTCLFKAGRSWFDVPPYASQYADGETYLLKRVEAEGRSPKIETLGRVVSIDGLTVEAATRALFGGASVRWDERRRRLYVADLARSYADLKCAGRDGCDFPVVVADKAGRSRTVTVSPTPRVWPSAAGEAAKAVFLAGNGGVLLLRVPAMSGAEISARDIREALAGRTPRHVVIDIRGNGGGDGVWHNLLAKLIARPVTWSATIEGLDDPRVRKRFSIGEDKRGPSRIAKDIQALTLTNFTFTIEPEAESIRFAHPIVVLQDDGYFSSAGSLSAVANLSDDLLSVGDTPGLFLGLGSAPLVFQLPNSGMPVRIPVTVDVTAADEPSEAFQNRVDVYRPSSPVFRELWQRTPWKERMSEPFLLRKDEGLKDAIAASKVARRP